MTNLQFTKKYLHNHWLAYTSLFALTLVGTFFIMIHPYILKKIVDLLSSQAEYEEISSGLLKWGIALRTLCKMTSACEDKITI